MSTDLVSLASDASVRVPLAVAALAITAYWLSRPSSPPPSHRVAHRLPRPLPIIGDLVELLRHEHRLHDWLSETSLRFHGDAWRVHIVGQKDLVVVTTPDAFEDVLVHQFDNFLCGEDQATMLEQLLGRSIITFDGDEWYRQRKAAAKFFSTKALRVCMLHTMRKNVGQMYEAIDICIDHGHMLNLSQLCSQFTLQTFAEVGLGVDLRWIGELSNPLEGVGRVASPATMRRFRLPMFYWKLERLLNIGAEKELATTMIAARVWFRQVITASLEQVGKRQQAGDSGDSVKSVVELFFEHSREDKVGLRLDDMVEFLLTFVLAAQDTSALGLSWFFWCLAKHPDVEARVRRELSEVLPQTGATQETYLTTDHVTKLVYLDATIREVLRLYPSVPLMQKEAAEATVICGDLPILKGDMMCLSIFAMARNPNVWGPDAAEFKPERWIDDKTGELRTFPASKFSTFSTGPRVCIGMKLAMLELRVVAANLLHRYKFSLAAPNDGSYNVGLTLLMKEPLLVRATRVCASAG